MNYWLVKSEPKAYSWQDLLKDKSTIWSGVRNYAARNNLRDMRVGDLVFYYHSNTGKEIVGIAKVVKEAYPDPTIDDLRWVAVDLVPQETLKNPVSLEDIKNDPKLQNMQLVTHSRLSVQKVTEEEFNRVIKLTE